MRYVIYGSVVFGYSFSILFGQSIAFSPRLPPVIVESKNNLVSAAVARGVSIATFFPIDTYKTLVQIAPKDESFSSTIEAHGGITSMWSGLLPSLVGQIPYGVLTFGGYEIYKKLIFRRFSSVPPFAVFVVAASLGDLTGSFWLCPSEVVKQQMQSGMWQGASPLSVVQQIFAHDGFFNGFYRGYVGNIVRDVPFRVFQLTTYEVLKSAYLGKNDKEDLTSLEASVIGAIAGTVSAAATTPLDVVKTMLMTGNNGMSSSWWGCFTTVYDHYGFEGLFAGIEPRVQLISLMSALFFVVNESVLKILEGKETEAKT